MTEGEFIRFYKNKNKSKSHKEVKEKIDLFWDALLKALEEDKRYTDPKEVIKFRAGKGLIKMVEGDADE